MDRHGSKNSKIQTEKIDRNKLCQSIRNKQIIQQLGTKYPET